MARLAASALQLLPRYLALVQDTLRQHLPQAEVWAYGSRVHGDCYEASDLDLVARNPADLHRETPGLARVQEAFADSDLPIIVQIVDWARIPASFHAEIEAGYVVVQPGASPRESSASSD